jgi:hypothetical protein
MTDQIESVISKLNSLQNLEKREEQLAFLCKDFTNNLLILMRAGAIFDLDNKALEQPYESLLQSIKGLNEILKVKISLSLSNGNFFVNKRLVKVDSSSFKNSRSLIKIFDFLDINELSFSPKVSKWDLKQLLREFIAILQRKRDDFQHLNLSNIESRKIREEMHPLLEATSVVEKVLAWYATACNVSHNFYKDSEEDRTPQYALLKRTMINLIELPPQVYPLLGRLDLLAETKQAGGALFIHSVEAAGLTAIVSAALKLDPNIRLALSTSAFQLFLGWSLVNNEQVHYYDPQSTHFIFEALEATRTETTEIRNEIVRRLIDLGGISESIIHRILITYEAQRSRESQWKSLHNYSEARPSRMPNAKRLYSGGLDRSFFADIVYGAHLYAYLRRRHKPKDLWKEFLRTNLLVEVKTIFYELIGEVPYGSPVILTDGQLAIVTGSNGEEVTGVAIIESGENSLKAYVKKNLSIQQTSPIQVEDFIGTEIEPKLTRETVRALLFSVIDA